MTTRPACPDVARLRQYLDGCLPADERDAFAAHLASCPSCDEECGRLAASWSLGGLLASAGADQPTHADLSALAARIPPATVTTDRDLDPPPTPIIPGLDAIEPVARGGMGIVYKARDTALDRPVAVKVLARSWHVPDADRARAEREAVLLARLDHPHVVRILAAGVTDGLPYLVMEWVEGETLGSRIERGTLPAREAARIGRDLARALEALHLLGIVHRDIKPENVLLAAGPAPGAPVTPKLIDFGLARPEGPAGHLTRATAVIGTPCYMAPEQTGLDPCLGPVGPATDIHAVGGTLLAMLTGSPPYEAPSPAESLRRAAAGAPPATRATMPGVPLDLRTILAKCLERDPSRRYASARDLADDLDRFLAYRTIRARRPSPAERLVNWARRRPLTAGASLAGILALVVAIIGPIYHVVELRRANEQIAATLDMARESLARLTDVSGEWMISGQAPLDAANRDALRDLRYRYARWPLLPDRAGGLRFRLRGLERLADIFTHLEEFEDALLCQRLVQETILAIGSHEFADDDLVKRRFRAMMEERRLLGRTGRVAEAEAASRRTIAFLETLPGMRLESGHARLDLAGSLAARGAVDEAVQELRDGLETMAAARNAAPDDPGTLHASQIAIYNASVLAFQAGRLDDQERFVGHLLRLSDEGMERFPGHRHHLGAILLPGMAAQADIALRHGRVEGALAITRRRSVLAAELARAAPPSDTTFLERQVDAAISLREILARLGRGVEAAGDLAEAVAIAERLHDAEPAVFGRTQLLVNVLACQAKVSEEAGDLTRALACQRRSFDLLSPWQKRDPASPELNWRVFGLAHNVAILSSSLGDLEEAAWTLEEALSFAPDDWKPDLLVHLARVRALQGDRAAARAAAERAIATDKADEARSILADLAPQPE